MKHFSPRFTHKVVWRDSLQAARTFCPEAPEEVHFTVKLAVPGEAFLRQVAVALATLDALGVPRSVEHVEEKAVQNWTLAAGTMDHHDPGLQDADDSVARTGTSRISAEQRLGAGIWSSTLETGPT